MWVFEMANEPSVPTKGVEENERRGISKERSFK